MAARSPVLLRRLEAELRAEVERVQRNVDELPEALAAIAQPAPGRLALYGCAALLDTYYSGIEKCLRRIADAFGGVPDGPAWHRQLLDDMTLDIPEVRPAVLSTTSAVAVEPYLAFRHRFRNLYLFDLDRRLLAPLLEKAGGTWAAIRPELEVFGHSLVQIAAALEGGD